jgi:DNA processing protein
MVGIGPRTARHLLGVFGLPDAIFASSLERIAAPAPQVVEPGEHSELLAHIEHDPVGLDALAERTGRDATVLATALLELELAQDIGRLPGKRYQRLR